MTAVYRLMGVCTIYCICSPIALTARFFLWIEAALSGGHTVSFVEGKDWTWYIFPGMLKMAKNRDLNQSGSATGISLLIWSYMAGQVDYIITVFTHVVKQTSVLCTKYNTGQHYLDECHLSFIHSGVMWII